MLIIPPPRCCAPSSATFLCLLATRLSFLRDGSLTHTDAHPDVCGRPSSVDGCVCRRRAAGAPEEGGVQKGPREDAAALASLSAPSSSSNSLGGRSGGKGGSGARGQKSPVGFGAVGRIEGAVGRKTGSKLGDGTKGAANGGEARVKMERGRQAKAARTGGAGGGGLDMDKDVMLGVHTLMMLANTCT